MSMGISSNGVTLQKGAPSPRSMISGKTIELMAGVSPPCSIMLDSSIMVGTRHPSPACRANFMASSRDINSGDPIQPTPSFQSHPALQRRHVSFVALSKASPLIKVKREERFLGAFCFLESASNELAFRHINKMTTIETGIFIGYSLKKGRHGGPPLVDLNRPFWMLLSCA